MNGNRGNRDTSQKNRRPGRRGTASGLRRSAGSGSARAGLAPSRDTAGGRPALPPSKADLRLELEQATSQFLQRGGQVTSVPTGTSAWEPGTRPPPSRPLFTQPREDRTPVTDVVKTIEERREAMKQRRKPQAKSRSQRSRKRVIYDDFGEPLRHVWVDE